jgi:hypothetical protein
LDTEKTRRPDDTDPPPNRRRGVFRIRLGVALVVLSWLPVAQVAIRLTGATGSGADHIRYAIWTIQVLIGFAGVAIAGKETIDLAKSVGWRRLPRVVWRLMVSPDQPIDTDPG